MLTFEVFLEGDFIINTDVMGSTMYFIHHGEAEVINCKGEPIRTLIDGDYFGGIKVMKFSIELTRLEKKVLTCSIF